MAKKSAPAYIMLGRVVVHNSPARLSGYIPPPRDLEAEHAQIASAAEAALKPKNDSEKTAQTSKNIGTAVRKYMDSNSGSWGTATQSPGYQSYRAGEREAY
jgi:hypothetical protein